MGATKAREGKQGRRGSGSGRSRRGYEPAAVTAVAVLCALALAAWRYRDAAEATRALPRAVAFGQTARVRELLARGASPHGPTLPRRLQYLGTTPRDLWGRLARPALFPGGEAPARRGEGVALLPMAAAGGREEIVRLLLEAGADPDERGFGMFHTPLQACAARRGGFGRPDDPRPPDWAGCARALLEHGARVDERLGAGGVEGQTTLMQAARHDNVEVAAVLLSHGADVNATDVLGRTALHEACWLRRPGGRPTSRMARLLLSRGADVNAPDRIGRTPLLSAVSGGAHRALAEGKARDDSAHTEELARLLLEAGADPNRGRVDSRRHVNGRRDRFDGRSALGVARAAGGARLAALLERAGARP